MGVMFSYISKHTENDQYSSKSIKYTILFILPISLVIAVDPDAFILLAFPLEYIAGAHALGIVAPGMGLLAMAIVLTNIFQARHAPKIPAVVLSIAVVIEIILLTRLIPEYGIVGAAASTTVACGFGVSVLAVLYVRMYGLKLDYTAIIKTIIVFCLLICFVCVSPDKGSAVFLWCLVFCAVVYVILLLVFRLIREEDVMIFISGLPEHGMVSAVARVVLRVVRMVNRL